MTKIYTYCLFDEEDTFCGVYSSLQAVHRDALRICNRGQSAVLLERETGPVPAQLGTLRKILKGHCDVQVRYVAGRYRAKIIKTKLKE